MPGAVSPRACVIGWPVAHSRSPLIHGFWLQQHGLDGRYDKVPVAPDDLPDFLAQLAREEIRGGNATIPHKERVHDLCRHLTPTAARLGAVNTFWLDAAGALCGDNTDGAGFLAALDEEAPGWDARRAQALVLGAGGAARAIVDALVGRGFARVLVANRSPGRAGDLLRSLGSPPGCQAWGWQEAQTQAAATDLLVNTTPAGMAGQPDLAFPLDALPDHAVVDDIVYVPRETPLLRAAAQRGLRRVGGLGMLLHQAAPGFARWFGVAPAVTPALRALVEADIAGAA